MPSIADRLAGIKQSAFVGRETEIALFRTALVSARDGDPPPFCVLYLFGPGGVGKSTLLAAFSRDCASEGVPYAVIDGRNIESTPGAFLEALRMALKLPEGDDPLRVLDAPGCRVLLIDTYEELAGLDGWLRDVFLPQLSGDALVVLAGRHPLPPAWLADPGWQSIVRTIPLRNLSGPESRAYLTRRAIPETLHRAAVDFTHGHPLALSLLADVFTRNGQGTPTALGFAPESEPDVVQALLERFVEGVPGPSHRAALEACALLRVTDEAVLRDVLRGENVEPRELFDWLRGLSFIETGAAGLFPHDVVREALLADLRWRDRERYVELHRRARDYFAARLRAAPASDQQRLLYDCIFLHRDNAVVRAAFTWQESHSVYPDSFRDSDRSALIEMTRSYEGDDSAALLSGWLERQPERTVVFRDLADSGGPPVGFFTMLVLRKSATLSALEDAAGDPGIAGAWKFLERNAPLRIGEAATHLRFWMARDSYQNPSPVQSLIIVHALRQFLTNSHLAFTFFACADPAMWQPVFDYVGISALSDAEFTVGERTYGVYGHDWRTMPTSAWLDGLFEREVAAGGAAPVGAETRPAPGAPPLIVLSEPDFAAAVRDALKNFHKAGGLLASPLLRSRVVVGQLEAGDDSTAGRAEILRNRIFDHAARLQAAPRQARGYRALYRTYLEPMGTQEQIAELLDLPFNTYRRHLGEGIAALTELLWREEIGESAQQ